jgi:CheY-like chemotaxis protein
MNLAINARDAMPRGGELTIRTGNITRGRPERPEHPPAGDHVLVAVADGGNGMPADVRERIFEPFFTTKEVGKGSGLGLPQVLGMAKQLGGGVSVESAPGRGTCVTIFLPRAAAVAVSPDERTSAGDVATSEAAKSGHILLVDDDPDVRSAIARALRDAGHLVTEAPTGTAALDILENVSPPVDLLLADVAIPGMNGVDLSRLTRQARPRLPTLFMTGYEESAMPPRDAGIAIIRKPFEMQELGRKVAQLIHR